MKINERETYDVYTDGSYVCYEHISKYGAAIFNQNGNLVGSYFQYNREDKTSFMSELRSINFGLEASYYLDIKRVCLHNDCMKVKRGDSINISMKRGDEDVLNRFSEMKRRYDFLRRKFEYLRHEKNGKIRDSDRGKGNGHRHSRRIDFVDKISKLEPNGHKEWDVVEVRRIGGEWKYDKIVEWDSPIALT